MGNFQQTFSIKPLTNLNILFIMDDSRDNNMEQKSLNHSDEELCLGAAQGDSTVEAELVRRYGWLVRACARPLFLAGGDSEDLIQEGMIGLFKAVRDFDSGRDASFFTFADLCISRQMYTAVQASRRQKHIPLNTYISLYATARENAGENEEDAVLVNILARQSEQSPEEMVIDRENLEQLEKIIEKELSGFEKQVLDLYLTGMRYTQIAKVLGRDEKSTDNALQRIKNKLKKAIRL